jgi:hypothetical protein
VQQALEQIASEHKIESALQGHLQLPQVAWSRTPCQDVLQLCLHLGIPTIITSDVTSHNCSRLTRCAVC